MDRTTTSADLRDTLYGAMELSKNTWLLAIQFPDRPQPSLYPIAGGNTEDLVAKLIAASDRRAKVSGKRPSITLCYEAGYDAFWLARFLKTRGNRVSSGGRRQPAGLSAWTSDQNRSDRRG